MRKRFVLSDKVNLEILRIVESGFIQKWIDVIRNSANNYKVKSKDTSPRKIPLRMGDLYPVFVVWIVGICVSICAFLGELLVHKLNKK